MFKLNQISSEDIVMITNDWLNDGLYTKSLGEFVFISNPIMSEVAPIFQQTMNELGLNEPTRLEAAKTVIQMKLEKLVERVISPEEGASFIYWHVYHELLNEFPDKEFVGDNLGLENIFCWLREIWDCKDGSMILYHTDLPRSEAEKKFEEYLIEEAQKWLENAT